MILTSQSKHINLYSEMKIREAIIKLLSKEEISAEPLNYKTE